MAVAVGWKLREVMARRQVSNMALAKKCRVHSITISRWKRYDELPPIGGEALGRLAAALEVEVSELLNLKEEKCS